MRSLPRHVSGSRTAALVQGPHARPARDVPTDGARDAVTGPPRARPAGRRARAAPPARHGPSRSPDGGERLLKEVTR